MENIESVKADVSFCAKYIKYLSPLPIEAILIQNFVMSFQLGDNSKFLDQAIARMLLKKDKYTKADIFTVVNKDRYYKCIYSINNIVEIAILKEVKDPDIAGVKFKSMSAENGKLLAVFEILK